MFRFFLTIALLFLLLGYSVSQSVPNDSIRDVEVCDLLKHPESFDSQVVRFRGQLIFEFENDHVNDDSCGLPILHRGIWWDYGGESILALAQDAKRIKAMTSPVQRDAQFALFEARTQDRRKIRPDGEPCHTSRECALYEVVATFTGRFLARGGGYGHKGCCHLIVIEQISDVEAMRTAVPGDDAKFECEHEVWQGEYFFQTVPGIDAHLATNKRFLADQMRTHGDELFIEAMERELSPFADLTGSLRWSSPDLLKTYGIRFHERSKSKRVKKQPIWEPVLPVDVQVTREQCHLLDN
jgi:hypothetical protein